MDADAGAANGLSRLDLELRASEARFSVVCESSPLGILLASERGECLYINPAAQQITGLTAEAAAGRGWIRALHPDDQEGVAAGWSRAADAHGEYRVPVHRFVRPDGDVRSVQVRAVPLARTPGEERAFLGILEDVTDRLRAGGSQALGSGPSADSGELPAGARIESAGEYAGPDRRRLDPGQEIVGSSPSLRGVIGSARLVAPMATTVLITGETGTGKELIARAIHELGPRRDSPLVKVNCAAISAGLVESELFGHEKGAFTGALQRRKGRFELAHGGTLFLDEVGELPLELQPKLLRVLQEREFERVGGNEPVRVDVRVVAATNRDLAEMVKQGRFREDLFYRLNVFPLALPPLRERAEDVAPLARAFVQRFARRSGKRVDGISPAALERLQAHHWPGNVRELENVIERAVILSRGPELDVDVLPVLAGHLGGSRPLAPVPPSRPDDGRPTLEQMTRSYVERVLQETRWIIEGERGAARRLGIHPNTLRSRLKRWGLTRPVPDRQAAEAWQNELGRRCG